jgi:RimJ/RimL family protein N-acetyltransferase
LKTLDYENQNEITMWAEKIIGSELSCEGFELGHDSWGIGLRDNGELVAAVCYDRITACDCNVHLASDGSKRWLNREFLAAGFAYPFIQLGLRRITGVVPRKNIQALKFDLHIGFEVEGLCRNALPDDDVYILGMLRENCKYLPKEYR